VDQGHDQRAHLYGRSRDVDGTLDGLRRRGPYECRSLGAVPCDSDQVGRHTIDDMPHRCPHRRLCMHSRWPMLPAARLVNMLLYRLAFKGWRVQRAQRVAETVRRTESTEGLVTANIRR